MEFTLLGGAAIAVAAMYATLWYEAGRTNAADCTRDVWDALVGALVVGLIVGRLVAMVVAGTNPLTNLGDILIVRGGVDTVAASMAGLSSFAWTTRSDTWGLFDAAGPAAIAGLAGWHGGCLVRDACLGTGSDLPWAMTQSGSSITRHPVELYAVLGLVVLGVALMLWKRHRPAAGVIGLLALSGASLVRLATEPMRPGLGGDLTLWYGLAAGTTLIGALWRHRSSHDGNAA